MSATKPVSKRRKQTYRVTSIFLTSHDTFTRASKIVLGIAHCPVLENRGGRRAGEGKYCDEALHVDGESG
jgi:hypothetical protein